MCLSALFSIHHILYLIYLQNQANFGSVVFNYDASFDFRRALKEFDVDKYENKWDAFLDYVEAAKQHSEDKRQRKLAGESFEHEKQRALEIKKNGGRRLQVEHFTGVFRNVLFTVSPAALGMQ